MVIYVRGSGRHTAERVRPVPGSDAEARLERLASAGEGGWRCLEDPPGDGEGSGSGPDGVQRPARSATKAVWLEYARAMQPGAALDGLTKEQLIETYGGED